MPITRNPKINKSGKKKRGLTLRQLIVIALLTTFLVALLDKSGIAAWILIFGSTQSMNTIEVSLLMYGSQLGLSILAGLPARVLMKKWGVKHYSAIALFAIAEATLLRFIIALAPGFIASWLWPLVMIILLLATYYAANKLYNQWPISEERRTIVILGALGSTLALFVTVLFAG